MSRQPNTLADYEEKKARQNAADAQMEPTVDEMAGADGLPIVREGITFYPRSPKIRVLDAMQETLGQMQAGGMKQGEAVLHTATFFLVVEEDGKRRQATFDEVADSFDLADVELLTTLSQKYLNVRVQKVADTARPNA